MTAAAAASSGMLEAEEDRYDGVIIKPDSLPADPATFKAALDSSLQAWSAQGKRGIWLKVPITLAQLIPVAVEPQAGFVFHHAEKDYVMMTKWLPETESTLPPNASHQVGVGAIVVNSKQEMLVVQEANGPLRGQGFWKMPTGLVHEGEDLIEAVEREVLEETGVRAVCGVCGRGQGCWKMPTGLVHEGKDLIEAVEREVLQETGVR
uniref:Nudix hydrolase domain-containing protein n=1 Tax=Tetradesmus obliquus TaxID=3088 RepID=A0A383VIN3_TETOB|eukprot:jgi/Sobl393_1/10069/SZX65387.1